MCTYTHKQKMSSGTRIQRSSGGTNNKGTSINNLTNSVTNKNQNAVSTKNKLNSASGQDTVKNQDKIQVLYLFLF